MAASCFHDNGVSFHRNLILFCIHRRVHGKDNGTAGCIFFDGEQITGCILQRSLQLLCKCVQRSGGNRYFQ